MDPSVPLEQDPIRFNIGNEIKKTEESYLNALKLIPEFFIKPLRQTSLIPQKDVDQMFTGIEAIIKFGDTLMEKFAQDDYIDFIGLAFYDMAPFLTIYTQYINNWENSKALLEKYLQKQNIATFLKDCENKASISYGRKTDLADILIQPIQRVPRYLLLLQDFLKHSNPEHPDYYCIKEAVVKIQSVAIKINEKKKYQEESQKLLQIQNSIDGNFLILVEAHRKFIREGDLITLWNHTPQELHFFLFNDILLFVSPFQEGILEKAKKRLSVAVTNVNLMTKRDQKKWIYVSFFELENVNLEDVPDSATYKHCFALVYPRKRFIIGCKNEQEKQVWMKAIDAQIAEQKSQNHIMVKHEFDALMHVQFSGYLWKRSSTNKLQWNRRFFRLKGSTLFYYHSPQDSSPRGHIVLKQGDTPDYTLALFDEKNFGFILKGRTEEAMTYYMHATDLATLQLWIQTLRELISIEKNVTDTYMAVPISDAERRSRMEEFAELQSPHEDLSKKDWFFGNIDRVQAEKILTAYWEDAFIVRSSSQKDHYAISLCKKEDRRPLHLLIRRIPDPSTGDPIYELQDAQGRYPTLEDLIHNCPQLSRFKAIKLQDTYRKENGKIYASVSMLKKQENEITKQLEQGLESLKIK